MIRAVDTNVAVVAVSLFRDIGADGLWLVFGSGKSYIYISFHIFQIHHALSDYTLARKGKKTTLVTWMAFEDVTLEFRKMIDQPTSPDMDLIMSLKEQYMVLL